MKTPVAAILLFTLIAPTTFGQLRVEASAFSPSLSEVKWDLVIDEAGESSVRTSALRSGATYQEIVIPLRPTKADFDRLKASIAKADFLRFPKNEFGVWPVESPFRKIKITMEGKTKEVTISWVDATTISSPAVALEFERLVELWRVIRSMVPDPAALDFRDEDDRALQQQKEGTNQPPQPVPPSGMAQLKR